MKVRQLLILGFGSLIFFSCGKPIADFGYKVKEEFAPASVDFENKSQKAETYEWDFGDGQKSKEESPEHEYRASGNYTVTLKASKGKKSKLIRSNVFIPAPSKCLVEIETSLGNMVVELYDATPKHRDNFIKLVEKGFYDELLFHRVIDGFMIQGGDPDSKNAKPNANIGSGGPGYRVPAEFVDTLIHVKGALAAARDNNPEKASSGSQFYLVQGQKVNPGMLDQVASRRGVRYSTEEKEQYATLGGTPHLDGLYTVFGRVIRGVEVIDKIASVRTGKGDRPMEDVKMRMRVIK